MLKQKVEEILVQQIGREAYSSNMYLSMASWAESSGYAGTAQWMFAQAEEERQHMLKFIAYVNDRGGRALIPSIEQPPADFNSVKDIFSKTMEHEEFITNSINDIVGVCMEEKDFTTQNWIQWFVQEQIEEEASVRSILDKLNLIGDGNHYMFDRDIMTTRNDG